jgi:hypothetical protein
MNTLEQSIHAYLKTRKSIYFKVRLNIQGGPLVEVYLKRVKIGEFYDWDSENRKHIKIVVGTEEEVKLRDEIARWVHFSLFDFMVDVDLTEWDVFKGQFKLEDDKVYLVLPGGFYEFSEVK